jgi:hypothetical protein
MARYTEKVAGKLYTYFTQKMGMYDYTKGWIKGDCPVCGKTNKYGVNLHTNKSNCFSCGYNAQPIKVIQERENLPQWHEVMTFINGLGDSGSFRLSKDTQEFKKRKSIELPEGFKLVGLYSSRVAKMVHKNLKSRGFNITKLMTKGVGYCITGKYAGRIIIPYYYKGTLVYFNARKFIDVGEKFKNPSEEEVGIGKSMLIYNHDALYAFKKVWLFESATNAITLGDSATGTGGKSLSQWQRNEYITSPCEEIIIGLDDDGQKEAYKLGMELAPFKKVKVLRFPKGQDANVIGAKATRQLEKESPYLSYKECYKLYINERTK